MTSADMVAAVMFAAITLYAVFAGADFGSGMWDLFAGDARKGAATRRLIDRAIGPVWEANHVWLIFVLVFLWTGFPRPFGQIMRDLAIPFWFVALGVVLRGAGFAFRKYTPNIVWARLAGSAFAISSLLTPFFLGTIAGAIASGRVGSTESLIWLSRTSIVGGVLAVATCGFLAAVFLVEEAARSGHEALTATLRSRALGAGLVAGAIAAIGVLPLRSDAPTLFDGLTGRASPLIVVSIIAGLTTINSLWARAYRRARVTAVVAVAAVVVGWGVGQYPWILVDSVEISDGAGHPATLTALLVATAAAAMIVGPGLVLLYRLADTNKLAH
jgi:cytochrome d ubiquinol oxidase subunit II